MRWHKKVVTVGPWFAALLAAQMMVGGCGSDTTTKSEDLKIAWIPKGVSNTVFQAGYQGALA